jgi:hypothetical protein
MEKIDLNDTYWDRLSGYVIDPELKIDARWVLRKFSDDKPYGSLRIASHPDCKPGYLRAIFTYVTTIEPKTNRQIIKATEDYQMDELDLEVYSINKIRNTRLY